MIKKILAILLTCIMLVSFASCSFIEEETGRSIDYVEGLVDGDKVYMAVYYTDVDVPKLIELPEGSGIASITSDHDAKNKKTIITVTLTDGQIRSFDVPDGADGKDGAYLCDISRETDFADGTEYLVFWIESAESGKEELKRIPFSDFKGEDGKDGIGFDTEFNVDGAFITGKDDIGYYFEYKMDGYEPKRIYVYYDRDIEMEYNEKTGQYDIVIRFNDGEEVVEFTDSITRPNTWLSGNDYPSNSIGIVGDFYFDETEKIIYQKVITEDGVIKWTVVADLVDISKQATLTVTFDANGGTIADKAPNSNGLYEYSVKYGTYFTDNGEDTIPIPEREGFKFMGWYKERTPNEAVDVKFNDFIQITSDISLIAYWVKDNSQDQ